MRYQFAGRICMPLASSPTQTCSTLKESREFPSGLALPAFEVLVG